LTHPLGYLVISVLLFGGVWPVSKDALQDATPLWFALNRAGMAAVQCGPEGFDAEDFWAAATERLPVHARPAFVRVSPQLETTGTMKFRKAAFQDAGYGEAVGAAEPLFVRLDAERCYAPLTPALRAALAEGSLRI
jgi:fatty-acyl-CoA synthase